jgi:hypothetical protein
MRDRRFQWSGPSSDKSEAGNLLETLGPLSKYRLAIMRTIDAIFD